MKFSRELSQAITEARNPRLDPAAIQEILAGGEGPPGWAKRLQEKDLSAIGPGGNTLMHTIAEQGLWSEVPSDLLTAEHLARQNDLGASAMDIGAKKGNLDQLPRGALRAVASLVSGDQEQENYLGFANADGSVQHVAAGELPRVSRVDFMENRGDNVIFGKGFLVNGDLLITSKKAMSRKEFSKVAEKEVNPRLAASFRREELDRSRALGNGFSLGQLLRPGPSIGMN